MMMRGATNMNDGVHILTGPIYVEEAEPGVPTFFTVATEHGAHFVFENPVSRDASSQFAIAGRVAKTARAVWHSKLQCASIRPMSSKDPKAGVEGGPAAVVSSENERNRPRSSVSSVSRVESYRVDASSTRFN